MVNPLVERATSDQLIGPDWALNLEICDILNRDVGQAKDVVRGLKKRIGHKNSKVQLLALTLLETVIKNCGDIVHMHVAEKDVLHEMVKIVKKKHPDFHVKEKILILVDTWQEAFGGARARYPQYYAAYQELLRAGAVFPPRSERAAAPIFTPPQSHPLASYPQNVRNSELPQDTVDSSVASDPPTLSLSEIQNARGIMDVLSEMLNALDPGNKEGLKQEVIVDLVEQCRSSKQRVVHLVNTTADEELLRQGLTLNDDLERVLAKHKAISSGAALQIDKGKALETLVDIGDSTNSQSDQRSSSAGENQSPLNQLLLPGPSGPQSSNSTSASLVKADPHMDLLSGDMSPPSTAGENALALVPVSQPNANAASSVMDLIVLDDMLPQNDGNSTPNVSKSPASDSAMYANAIPAHQSTHRGSYPNGSITSNFGQSSVYAPDPMWNGAMTQSFNPEMQQATYGTPGSAEGSFPPPPWEVQPSEVNGQAHTSDQLNEGIRVPDGSNYTDQPIQNFEQAGVGINSQMPVGYQMGTLPMYPQQMQSGDTVGMMYLPQMQNGQPMAVYQQPVGFMGMAPQALPGGQFGGYVYGQYPNGQAVEQQMYGLSMQDSYSGYNATSYKTSSHTSPKKPLKPQDKLFGDLVSFPRPKPSNPNNGNSGGT